MRVRDAFTLIELLVVIAVVALLIGILLPALSGARRSAEAVEALAAARSLTQAVALYANDHAGAVIPSYLSTQQAAEGVRDEFGNAIGPPVSQRWAYRLGPYFSYGWGGTTHVGGRSSFLEDQREILAAPGGAFNWSYQISVFPSFGINRLYIGGDHRQAGLIEKGHHTARLDQAFRPSRLLAFATARFDVGTLRYDGYLEVDPPPLGAVYDEDAGTASPADAFGRLHARHGGRVITGWLDGHAGKDAPESLLDRRRWADPAARRGEAGWEP